MSDQAIIGLVVALGSGISCLIYFLMSNVKYSLKSATDEWKIASTEILSNMKRFVDELAEVRENVAVKSTMLDYLQREVDAMKRQCFACHQGKKKSD
jgi:uncharacterized membrane protein YgaE (UPF0421/DUF939 family)